MNDEDKTKQKLIAELEALRVRVAELEGAGSGNAQPQEHREPGDGSCQADITGRTEAEAERDHLRTTLTAAIECLPFGLWALGPEGRYIMENAANRSVWGEVVGRSPAEVAGDEKTLSLWLDNNRRAWAGEKVEGEAELTAKGEIRTYRNVIAPIRMGGHIIGILGVNVDITERKRAEEALRFSEAKYRRLYDSMRDAFVSVTMDGKIQEYNEAYRRMLGYEPEELTALTFWDLTPSRWHAFQDKIIKKQVLVRGYSDIYEKEYRRKDGTVIPVELRTELLRDDKRHPCGMWAIIRDITERKRNEKALQESEGRYRAVAESTRDIIYILDREGTLLFANKAASQCIGIEPGEIVGKRQADLFPPEMAQAHVEKTRRVFATGEAVEEDEVFHFGPEEVWLRVHLLPLRDETGHVTSIMGVCHNITERKRAEEALQKAHDGLEKEVKKRTTGLAIFRRFAEASGRGFGMANLDGRITYVNPALCRLCGEEKPEDVIGKHVSTYFPKGFGQRWNKELVPAVFRQGSWHGEEKVLSCNGSLTPVLLDGSLIRDENGKPLRIALAIADVSELKRTEEALRRSEERFELAARGAGVGIWDWDIRTGRVYYSPRWKRLFGYEENEIGDGVDDWARLLHPDEREWIIKFQEDFLAGTSPTVTAEYRLRHKDGSYRWIEAHAVVVRNEEGKACRLVGSHGDITARKQAEESLRQSLDELQAIYDQMADGIIIVDMETAGHIRVNAAVCRMLGYSEVEMTKILAHQIHPPEVMPEIRGHLQAVAEGRAARFENMPFLRRDGSVCYCDVTSTRILYDERFCRISFLHDVTERKQAQETLERERRTLEHMLRASDHERQLIAYDIHDGLAQHLAGAIMQFYGFAHLKDTEPWEAADAYQAGMAMLRQGHSEARRLISDVRPPILDEDGVVAAIAHLVNERRLGHGPKIEVRNKFRFSRLVPIFENAIYRIVQESLTNACKHSRSERVRITMRQRGDSLYIEIRDWGVGFDVKASPESRFGLAGILERARLLGGRARIRSTAGKGTWITVELPVAEREPDE